MRGYIQGIKSKHHGPTTTPPPPSAWFGQNYNTGNGATLPYATECTIDEGTCDPDVLMQWLDKPDSAEGIDLELAQNAEPGDAVGEVGTLTHYHTSRNGSRAAIIEPDYPCISVSIAPFLLPPHSSPPPLQPFPCWVTPPVACGDLCSTFLTILHGVPRGSTAFHDIPRLVVWTHFYPS